MKFVILTVASAKENWSDEAAALYFKKLKHFVAVEKLNLKTKKISRDSAEEKIKAEGQAILSALQNDDLLVVFDEKGKSFTSIDFSKQIERILLSGKKRCVFLIGGAYGIDTEVKKRAQLQVSLAPFVMNHLIAEVVALEQIYRAFTIIKNIPYHNL
jgi:23S rRNA (pseudouridine1915-N3)-methyltransferase